MVEGVVNLDSWNKKVFIRNSVSKKKWVKHQKVSKVDAWKEAVAR